jgi:hypothetical protein
MSEDSPNSALDKAVKELLKDAANKESDELLIERRRKSIMVAISWEKTKNAILGKDDDFDADNI